MAARFPLSPDCEIDLLSSESVGSVWIPTILVLNATAEPMAGAQGSNLLHKDAGYKGRRDV